MASVTFVVATYNRPEPLRLALASVLAQRRADWRVIVVGDACGPETAEAVAAFDEPRFRYLNLPARFGDQSGPNSVGMALAETPYVALLNHDDVLLPDHLDVALGTLEGESADLFIGRAAMAWAYRAGEGGEKTPVFSWITPEGRLPREVYTGSFLLFEPVSAWVMRRSVAERVGPWPAPRGSARYPIQAWLMRAWRAGTRFALDGPITTLNMLGHWQGRTGAQGEDWYTQAGMPASWLLRALTRDPDALRHDLQAEVAAHSRVRPHRFYPRWRSTPARRVLHGLAVNPATAWAYRRLGVDAFEPVRRAFDLSYRLRGVANPLLIGKTGFDYRAAPDIHDTIRWAQATYGGHLWREPAAGSDPLSAPGR